MSFELISNNFKKVILLCLLCCVQVSGATIKLPVELNSWTIHPTTQSVPIALLPDTESISGIYLRIHNLKFANQLSVRLNSGNWHHINNDSVEVFENESLHDGIGGTSATIRLIVRDIANDFLPGQENWLHIRLNGTNGETSSARVIALNVLANDGSMIFGDEDFEMTDPSEWTPIYSNSSDIAAGENLWNSASIYNNPINKTPIRANCSSCHFDDGSDLKYFNYSDESIITRSQFHGLTYEDGKRIASYIRALNTPAPGRPWNPPFQPGPGLDPLPSDSNAVKREKADNWMAGAGLDWVLDDEGQVANYMFPDGINWGTVGALLNRESTTSMRVLPLTQQMPDWNMWLPKFAPEDIWPAASDYEVPWNLYQDAVVEFENQTPEALAAAGRLHDIFSWFNRHLDNWHGDVRGEGPESPVGLRRYPHLTREAHMQALQRWKSIKIYSLVRQYGIEDIHDDEQVMRAMGHDKYTNEILAIPGLRPRANIWALAPHIISDNIRNFEGQQFRTGKMESSQWYHLALMVTSGQRAQIGQNSPMDWNYLFFHYQDAFDITGKFNPVIQIASLAKMLQNRDTGAAITRDGYTVNTMMLYKRFTDSGLDRRMFTYLDQFADNFWRMTFEEYLHEWLDLHEQYRTDDEVTIPRDDEEKYYYETALNVPEPGVPFSNTGRDGEHINTLYNLIPKFQEQGIDELTLTDLANWLNRMWPYDANRWGDVPSWYDQVESVSLYAENFEDVDSSLSFLSPMAIKDADGVNLSGIPSNGGSSYVGQGFLNGGSRNIKANTTADISDVSRIKIRARVAFVSTNEDAPNIVLRIRSNVNTLSSTPVAFNPALLNEKFQTFEAEFDLPTDATALEEVTVRAANFAEATGDLYVDNVVVIPVKDRSIDTTPPPVVTNFGHNNAAINSDNDSFVLLKWNAVEVDDLAGYRVYRRLSSQGPAFRKVLLEGMVAKNKDDIKDESAKPGIEYIYEITAVDNAGNESAFSNAQTLTLNDSVPTHAPREIWAVNGIGQIEIGGFGAPDVDLVNYQLYRRVAGNGGFELISEPQSSMYFNDTDVQLGQSYEYYIAAVDWSGNLSVDAQSSTVTHEFGLPELTFPGAFMSQVVDSPASNLYDVKIILDNPLQSEVQFRIEVDGITMDEVFSLPSNKKPVHVIGNIGLDRGPRTITLVLLQGNMTIENIELMGVSDLIYTNGFEN